ncbi:hypothetical protein EV356DRAFT_441077 [Viridothelium virens]|uniref:tRNA (guanine(37)-N1)-methyltransferase n=1 Tax=Viridothelium virens TaxID=1048519 RepID=A0A6A6HJ70_VIRVR|nr:hypothetical protein EV356DRAFT_441077 [Viridothelium virens]
MADDAESLDKMFRPPINRAMRSLDRAFFHKRIPICAARVLDNKTISKCLSDLQASRDILKLDRIANVRPDPVEGSPGRRCLLLKPEIQEQDSSTWSSKLRELVQARQLNIIPYELHLDYSYWTYHDIISSILPRYETDEIPSGFSTVGHVVHLNLREPYLPYKHLIAEVIRDKNSGIKTVINKLDDVGEENEYRTFRYEVLVGNDDLNVEVREEDCVFRFDYSKVYWNPRLNTEHRRLIEKFQEGEAVCDVMAGIGPFAVPAGKKHVFVKANDLNPDGYKYLADAIVRNKVNEFVEPFNDDGHDFIKTATARLLQSDRHVELITAPAKVKTTTPNEGKEAPATKRLYQPKIFDHFVMNLPASAITFLPSFVGLYSGQSHLFQPYTETLLPMIHVYCFSTKSDDNLEEKIKICNEISQQLKYEIRPDAPEMEIYDVRDVAPNKRMFCASFRLPVAVAFRAK